MIRVLIVDDFKAVREGLKIIIENHEGFKVIDTAINGEEAIEKSNNQDIDVILMDIRMPKVDGIQATKEIKRVNKDIKILILTTFDDEEYIINALSYGATGYIFKDIEEEKLIKAIEDCSNDEFVLPTKVAYILAQKALSNSRQRENRKEKDKVLKIDILTERETEIAMMVSEGFTNKQIAKALFISEGTVKNYISSIYSKLKIKDRTKLAIFIKDFVGD